MKINSADLYRFPWSKTDNPGGWIEVTDSCNIKCKGCYRSQLKGHRDLDDVKQDILDTIRLTNCDYITIAGWEPLIYPHLLEVVKFIYNQKVKPIIFTNGVEMTPDLLKDLLEVGLAKIHIHVDSMQERIGWQGKNETELNKLRMHYADMIYQTGKIQCGFHVTVYRSNLDQIPAVFDWIRQQVSKVQHISFIAFRMLPSNDSLSFYAAGKKIPSKDLLSEDYDPNEISITTEEMYAVLKNQFSFLHPCAYLNGTTHHESYKFLIMVNYGTHKRHYGNLGKKSMELIQMGYHLFNGKYFAFLGNPKTGKKLFLLSLIDKQVRKGFKKFLYALLKNPLILFESVYAQSLHLQQPNEVIDGKVNLCDDCVNMMAYKGKLINSCRLDEYRNFGDELTVVETKTYS